MRPRMLRIIGSAALGLSLAVASMYPASAAVKSIVVPEGFTPSLSDTRATGHYEVQGSALHIWTEGATSTDKVAEYVTTSAPLAGIGEPSLEYAATFGIAPGYQLVVDFNNDSSADGILVGEPDAYGNDWWASNSTAQFVKDGAPSHTGGSGSNNHGTLDQWRAAFPDAVVLAFGFSLGSGVHGDGLLNAINFNGDRYTFRPAVKLTDKLQCKNGGWATSTSPVFTNQGDCVSHFSSGK